MPLVLAIGTWKFHGGKDFLIIKNKRQAVIIDITGEEYARIVVSTNHAADLIDTLNVEGGAAAEAHEAKAKPVKVRAAKQPRAPKVPTEPVVADVAEAEEAAPAPKPVRAPRKPKVAPAAE
ncbi:hypothetical protein D9M71_773860 [compost metagenome]